MPTDPNHTPAQAPASLPAWAIAAATDIMAMNYPSGYAITNVATIIARHAATPESGEALSRESVEFLLSQFGAAYSMLPITRNADRQKVITAAHQAMAEREKVKQP